MILGDKIREAIEKSPFSPEQIAGQADMSVANLYRIYKKDSTESKYLVHICNMLGVDMNYFFKDQLTASYANTGQSNFANQVGNNKQQIRVGGVDDCLQKLEALQKQYALLEKTVADKDMIIELLRGQK